jgi:hypothetical protein
LKDRAATHFLVCWKRRSEGKELICPPNGYAAIERQVRGNFSGRWRERGPRYLANLLGD